MVLDYWRMRMMTLLLNISMELPDTSKQIFNIVHFLDLEFVALLNY